MYRSKAMTAAFAVALCMPAAVQAQMSAELDAYELL
jgi:hypothetical protein